ncbi:Maf family protein [Alphaproteobacteria bacterium]|nr:Maf family protein [Alphaproteobacteria bacterium]
MNNFINPHLTKQVIIGTKSQSRRKLFKMMHLKFQYRSANINEKAVKNLKNDKYDALKIAKAKAIHLSKKNKNKIIITFDTTILHAGKTIYKCHTKNCCKNTLKSFNNTSHNLYTGMVFMINNSLIRSTLTKTKILFKKNKIINVNKYVERNFNQISSAVGCYNVEGKGKIFFKNIEKSYFNVIGIDIINFLKILRSI